MMPWITTRTHPPAVALRRRVTLLLGTIAAILALLWFYGAFASARPYDSSETKRRLDDESEVVKAVSADAMEDREATGVIRTALQREIHGTVTTPDGQAVTDASVQASASPGPNGTAAGMALFTTRTQSDGSFHMSVANDSTYFLRAILPNHLCDEQLNHPSPSPDTVRLTATPIGAYGIVAFDASNGAPITYGMSDTLLATAGSKEYSLMLHASTDLLRAARASGLDPGVVALRLAQRRLIVPAAGQEPADLKVTARVAGYRDAEAIVSSTTLRAAVDAPVTVMLEPAPGYLSVDLTLEEAGARPAGAQYVVLRLVDHPADALVYRAVDPSERVVVMLPAGSYEGVFSPSKFDWTSATQFTVAEGRPNRVTLRQPAKATLRVSDPDHPESTLLLRRLEKQQNGSFEELLSGVWPSTELGIVLRGLEPGQYRAEAWFVSGAKTVTMDLTAGNTVTLSPSGVSR